MGKVSVIIPVYQVENYLRKCVDSVIVQSHADLEIILVDDGSPDTCPHICDEYSEKDDRIVVIHQENAGLSCARNTGIECATGDYIYFLDSDDYIQMETIAILYALILETNADIAIGSFLRVDKTGCLLEEEKSSQEAIKVFSKNEIMNISTQFSCRVAWNKLYKKNIFQTVRFPKGKCHEDEFVFHEVFDQTELVACSHMITYYYLQREDSIMGEQVSIKRLDAIEAFLLRGRYALNHECYTMLEHSLSQIVSINLCFFLDNPVLLDRNDSNVKAKMDPMLKEFRELFKSTPKRKLSIKVLFKIYLFLISPKVSSIILKNIRKMKGFVTRK